LHETPAWANVAFVFDRRTGDGFIQCSDGHVRWGIYGAAGVVFLHRDGDEKWVMLQKRSAMAHEGGTWSCAGGALNREEMPLDGALREAVEEVGVIPEPYSVLGRYIFKPALDWAYTTLVVEVHERFGASLNFETEAVAWVDVGDVDQLALHAGFAAAWPHVRAIIEPTDEPH